MARESSEKPDYSRSETVIFHALTGQLPLGEFYRLPYSGPLACLEMLEVLYPLRLPRERYE